MLKIYIKSTKKIIPKKFDQKDLFKRLNDEKNCALKYLNFCSSRDQSSALPQSDYQGENSSKF